VSSRATRRTSSYARASARGILLGLLISVCVIAPFAINAADPNPASPSATTQPQDPSSPGPEPTATPVDATPDTDPEIVGGPTPAPTDAPASAEPTANSPPDQTPIPTDTPTAPAQPTPEGSATPSPAETPAGSAASPTPEASTGPDVPYIVTFGSADAFNSRAALFAGLGVAERSAILALRIAFVAIGGADLSATLSGLRAGAGVARLEADVERTIEATPDDPGYAGQWALGRIGWAAAYGSIVPGGHAVVAVLDTGVDATHADLAGQLVPGASFVDGATADHDPNGHGTQMAGIIAARTGNGLGLAGVAFAGVQVMPVTVLGADGTGSDSAIIEGVVWATDHGADVISMSFSSPTYSPALQAALDYAWDHDVVLVAATGNDGSSVVTYPAGDRGVIGVSNTDDSDHLDSSSNFGADTFLAAPGTAIDTTTTGGTYLSISGTSASAAMVAAAAGLLRANDPGATNGQVTYRLAITADDVAPVDEVGNGRLDLIGALTDASSDSVRPAGAGVLGDGGPIVEPYVAAVCAWTGTTSTNWEVGSNWSGCFGPGGIPATTDNVSIGSTTNAPLISAASGTVAVHDVTIAAGVTVSQTGGTLQVSRDWKNAGTFNGTGGTVEWTGSNNTKADFATSNQFYDVIVDATFNPGFDLVAGSQILISHNFTNNSTALTAGTNATFVFNGTGAQTISSVVTGTAATFGNLTVNKSSGTVTYATNANVTTNLTLTSGTLDLAGFTANRAASGAGLTMAAGTLLRIGGTASGPTNYSTATLNVSSTVEYYGTNQTVSGLTYGNLTLNGGGTKTAAAAMTVAGAFLLDTSTTFAASTFTHNFSGAFTNNGTFTPSTGTANFSGTADQSIAGTTAPQTFNNLTVNKASGVLSPTSNLSIAGNLTVTAGTLSLGSFTADRTSAGGTLSVAATGILKIGGTNGFPANYTTNTLNATSTVEYNGTAQTVAAQTYGNLTLSGGNTKTPAAGLTVATTFTIATSTTFAAGSLTHNFGGDFTNNGTFSPGTSTAVFTEITTQTIGGTTATTFGAISVTTGVVSTSISISATSMTLANNAAANSFTVGTGTTTTVNGNVTINQASGGTVVHALNVNAGTMDVTGSVTLSVATNIAGRVAKIVITAGTLDVDGDVTMTNSFAAANSIIDMSGGAGTLALGGALTVNTLGTLTPGTSSTVSYDGTGAQTVTVGNGVTYSTLKIDKASGTATLGAALTTANVTNITLTQGILSTSASNFAITMAGTWTNNGGTLSGGTSTVTFSGTSAVIAGTSATTFPAVSIAAAAVVAMNNSNSASSLAFVATGAAQSLNQASGTTLTVSGAVTMNQPAGSFTSAWNINAGTATVSGLITFAGSNTTAARLAKIVITSGTLNANAGITFVGSVAASKVIDMSGGAGTLNLKGALTVPAVSSTLTAGTAGSTFVYADTAAQTINYFTAGAYHNLSVSNSNAAGATLSAAITTGNVTGNVRVLTGGKLDTSTFAITGTSGKTLEVQDGATLRMGGTIAFPTGFTTVTLGGGSNSSTIEFYGGAQNVAATATLGTNYDNLNLSGTAVTKTLLGNITADALLTVSSTITLALSDKNATAGSLTGAGTIQFGAGAVANTLTVGSDGTSTTFSGIIGSTNDTSDAMVKIGSGTLTLLGVHTFTGTYKASAGTLLVTGTLATTSTATLDGGTFAGTGTLGAVTGTGSGGTLAPGDPATSLAILAARSTTFAAASTYSVQLNGTIAGVNHDQLSVTGSVNLASSTLSLSLGYTPSVGDSFTIVANDSTDAVTGTFTGQAEGSTITVGGVALTVSYVGGTGNDVVLSVGTITDTWTGATSSAWSVAGNWQDNRVPATGHALIFPSGASSFTPSNDLTAATSFASVTISGSGYTISGNSITLGGGMTASNSSGSNTVNLAVVLSADRTVTVTNSSATLTLSGVVSGSFNLTKAGSGTLILTASNTYSATTISAGTLQIGGGSTTGTLGSGSVTNNAALVFNRSNAITVNAAIGGSGTIAQSGSGTLTLGGSNSYSGATTISAGTLSISADNNLGTAPGSATPGQLTFSGGSLATTATITLNSNRGIAFSSTGTIDVASSTTLTYGGIAAGASGLTKTGSGILIVSGANSYSGATTISNGTLRQGAASSVPSASALTVSSGATFDLNSLAATVGSLAGAGDVTLGSATLTCGSNGTSTVYSGTLSGTGGLTKSGSGTFDISGASITVGVFTISAGSITAPISGHTLTVNGAWTNNSAASAFMPGSGTVTLSGGSSQTVGGSFSTSFSGLTVNNSAGITLSAGINVGGTLTLTSGNITTSSNDVYVSSTGTVSRTSGHIVGNLRKYIASGATSKTFEIGDSGAYAPVVIAFASVTTPGDVTATTASGDHPNIATSLINASKSVNRYWTLTNSGTVFTTYDVTLTFVAGDIDAGASTSAFFVDRYSAGAWTEPAIGTRTSTTTQATGLGAFGALIVGEPSVSPPGSLSASAVSTRRIDLSWTDLSSTETGYAVEKGTDGVTYTPYTTTAANATSASVTGLSANTAYYFRVRTVTASSYSPWVYVSTSTLAAPAATADSYTTTQNVTLVVAAPGVLANDPDGTNGIFTASKASDPANGSVVVNSNGSFTYTPTTGFSGTDSFTYKVNDGGLQSAATTVTITVGTNAYVSASTWGTSADASRYIEVAFPAYVPTGGTVHGATFTNTYRPDTSSETTCYYIAVYASGVQIATHGSSGSPISCSTGTSFHTDVISLPEVNTAARANALSIRLIIWSSGGGRSQHSQANLSVDYHLD
jgi:fibronectin-binding autotransporter adhesin